MIKTIKLVAIKCLASLVIFIYLAKLQTTRHIGMNNIKESVSKQQFKIYVDSLAIRLAISCESSSNDLCAI